MMQVELKPICQKLEKLIDVKVQAKSDWIVGLRRQIHAKPELADEEEETGKLISATLTELGWDVQANVAGYGVVAVMEGAGQSTIDTGPGPCIGFRADMDALPIHEETGADYASQIPGKMHACGHDNHIAMLLGMGAVLAELRDQWAGIVKLFFEPAEETGEGAPRMIEAGILRDPDVDFFVNIAVGTGLDEGMVRIIEGVAMPRVDNFTFVVNGEASHGGEPHRGVDAVVLSAEIIMLLQRIVSRQTAAATPIIINVAQINGGRDDGILPDRVEMSGTIRTFSEEQFVETTAKIEKMINGLVQGYGGSVETSYELVYPIAYNEPWVSRLVADVSHDVVGEGNYVVEKRPDWGGDSYAYYAQEIPGTYTWLGVRNEDRDLVYPVHHPKFDVNDEVVVPLGVRLGCRIALRGLKSLAHK